MSQIKSSNSKWAKSFLMSTLILGVAPPVVSLVLSSSVYAAVATGDEVANAPLIGVTQVAGNWENSYALKSDGTLLVWGTNEGAKVLRNGIGGELWDRVITKPIKFSGISGVSKFNVGFQCFVAVKTDGTVWGYNVGLLTENEPDRYSLRQLPITGVKDAATSGWHTLFVKTDGTVWAIGSNYNGELGMGNTVPYSIPKQVSSLTNVKSVVINASSSFALKNDGTVWAWGSNDKGQLGDAINANHLSPVQVMGLSNIMELKATSILYGSRVIARKGDGTVWTWGDGVTTPAQVVGLTGVASIAAGSNHYVVAKTDGTVWTWGNNYDGQLGNATITNSTVPMQVKGVSKVKSVDAGDRHSLAVREDGSVMAWGANNYGQLGNGQLGNGVYNGPNYTGVPRTTPMTVARETKMPYDGDVSAPTVPNYLVPVSILKQADGTYEAIFSFEHSSDNVKVKRYDYFKNGVLAGSVGQLVNGIDKPNSLFKVSGLVIGQDTPITVQAVDFNGNRSAMSAPYQVGYGLDVRQAILYYKLPVGWTSAVMRMSYNDGPVSGWSSTLVPSSYPGYMRSMLPAYFKGISAPFTVNYIKNVSFASSIDSNIAKYDDNAGKTYTLPITYMDANGGQQFNTALSLSGGVIASKEPVDWDKQAPTAPLHLSVVGKSSQALELRWVNGLDNSSVQKYEIYESGVLDRVVVNPNINKDFMPSTLYSGLPANAKYIVTVKAVDAAGNRSVASNPVTVTMNAAEAVNPTATVYYKLPAGWAQAYVHYRLSNSSTVWTALPGTKMKPSEYPGYWKLEVDLGTVVGTYVAEAVFNNGSGIWDNNAGLNYKGMYEGLFTAIGGKVWGGAPLSGM